MYRNVIFFGKIDWSMNSERWWVGDCYRYKKKIIFIFKTQQKIVTKLRQYKKLGPFSTFQLFKLSKLCYHFLSSFENLNIFFISLAIPRPLPSEIHWPINFAKKNDASVCFKQQQKSALLKCWEGSRKNLSLFFFFWKYTETSTFLAKLIGQWIPHGDGRGIARDMKKYFH